MSGKYLSMVSLTYAYKAQSVLREYGICATIVNAPKKGSSECGYAIVVDCDYQKAYVILTKHHIQVIH